MVILIKVENMEKRLFFHEALVGLGKYRMGSYGRIGAYCTYQKPSLEDFDISPIDP